MMLKKTVSFVKKTSLCLLGLAATQARAQSPGNVKVYGTVYDAELRGNTPLDFVSVAFPDYAIGTTTDADGHYSLPNIPLGKARMRVTYLGKLPIDTLVDVTRDMRLDFRLHDENFKIKEVVVTATSNDAGQATSSTISRMAMDHLQATSLSDIMSLMPGGLSTNPTLNDAQQINIRQVSSATANDDLNGLGTAIIRDGAPISNNANLSSMNPTVAGSASALAGGASPSSGTDVRSISTENIESVEVIRGIPSVEYGDLTSGAVIIRTKAGREPLRIKAKANPNVYQASMGTGFDLGGSKGALNVSADYAYNINNPTASYQHYQRATARVLYSNVFFNNRLRSNTSLDFTYGKDTRDRNPDDERTQTASDGRDAGFTFNTNGTWNINHGWLQNLRYVASATYTDKSSFYEQVYSQANAYYSMTTTDGAILSNLAGQHLYDADGNEITHFGDADAQHYAQYLPASYKGRYDIDSKEINVYAKLTANLFKRSGNIYNRILFGADFKSDGNRGDGKPLPSAARVRQRQEWAMHVDSAGAAGDSSGLAPMLAIRSWIMANAFDDITVAKVAARFHYSPSYQTAMYRRVFGVGVAEQIIEYRIDRARELLSSTASSVADIAREVGYADPKYFMRVFKRRTGLTPGQYRDAFPARLYNTV